MLSIEKSGFANHPKHTHSAPVQRYDTRSGSHARVGADHKTYRTYLNSTQNAIFYSNMDEIVAVIPFRIYGAQRL